MPVTTEHSMLPVLDAAQSAQSAALLERLRALFAAQGGWLRFDEFLQQVLYAPGLGYYSAGAAKLGAAGDFTTAPELSALFGQCIARQAAPVIAALGGEAGGASLLELGPGSGALAATVLARLESLGALPRHYDLLEVSADLRARQQARIAQLPAHLAARVRWLERLPAEPLRGLILANEVADALPFRCFAATDDGYVERGVALDAQGSLAWAERPADAALRAELGRLFDTPLAAGQQGEYCPTLNGWIASLAGALAQGVLLLFDYGLGRSELYHASRSAGTLRCHYRHRAHDDPFLHPGLQDITAWVDFTRVAEAAVDAGLEVRGYCTQAAFLLGAGIQQELAVATDLAARARLASEARQLLLPGEMGETFKAIALSRDLAVPLAGFVVQDLRRLL